MNRSAGSPFRALCRSAAALALLALAACAPQQRVPAGQGPSGPAGPAVDADGPATVALLVPTGSGDATRNAIGTSLQNAAQLAVADLRGARIDLRIYPTGGRAAGGADAARRAMADGADLIVGPLIADVATAVAPIAAAEGVNVLSFSNTPSIAGGNLFITGITFEDRANRVVGFASSRGLRNIGVIYPEDQAGFAGLSAVEQAAPRFGASVVARGSYPKSTNGITRAAPDYVAAVRDAGANGIVMPDFGSGLLFAASFLPVYGVQPGQTQLLGLRDLNRTSLLQEAGLQGMWFPMADPGPNLAFQQRYRDAYGEPPHPLAGIAYDTVAAAGAMLADARQSGDDTPFSRDDLTDPGGFAGVNGIFRYLPNGRNQRGLAVMEVNRAGAVVVDPAPRRFVQPGA
ncbi:MAG: penicillin-binding protein activator [Pseudomonadota bacterium]